MSDTSDKTTRKRLTSEERREAFITQAIAYFAEEGFEGSTRELARRLGVTQPLLYRYFPSKDDLVGEVYERVFINRWNDAWGDLLRDRSRPVRDRLIDFYHAYTDVVFSREWMRIFLFSGLKGVGINRRYIALVHGRILDPIVRECRHEAGLEERAPTEAEIEVALTMHGGIFYYGVRSVIYEAPKIKDKSFVISSTIDIYLEALKRDWAAVSPE